MSQGIIFYNYGRGCIARMVVAAYTLRKYYRGDVTILSDGEESDALCKQLAADKHLRVNVLNGVFEVQRAKNHHYLSKCKVHEISPYDTTLYLDSDIIVVAPGLEALFPLAEKHDFVVTQFSSWRSNGRTIAKRIMQWKDITPTDMVPALNFGPAVNTGVFAFTKKSTFMADWSDLATQGKKNFIPDEISCQVALHRYPHKVVDCSYNMSCKYDDLTRPDIKVIHYHGRKHCRAGLPYGGDRWLAAYKEVWAHNIANIRDWTPGDDKRLRAIIKLENAHAEIGR